jgi:hypothetical protein
MGTQRVQMKGVLTWLVRWTVCHAGTRAFCSVSAALVGPVQNIFFLAIHYFNSFVSIAQYTGQEAMLGSTLLVCVQSLYVSVIETEAKGDAPARLS